LTLADLIPYAQVGGTIAAAIGSCIAAIGLFINAWQFRRSRKATTLQHLQDFFKAMNERELALASAKDDAAKQDHAFVEYLNFLEVYSAALNDSLFIGVARELVCDKILDALVLLGNAPQWHEQIEKSFTSHVTYKHIIKFMSRQRRALSARKTVAVLSENKPPA
jgi:hypothetical protein